MNSDDIVQFQLLRTVFFSNQSQLISQDKELDDFVRKFASTSDESKARIKSRVKLLHKSIENFKQNIELVRELNKSNDTSQQIQTAFRTEKLDILDMLDNAKKIISNAQSRLENIQEQYNLKAKDLAKKLDASKNPFDKLQTKHLSPENFIQYGLSNVKNNPVMAQRCFEKAAQLYLDNNQLEQALSVRKQMTELFPVKSTHFLFDIEGIMQISVKPPKTLSEKGMNVSGLGTGQLKRGQMNFRKRNIDGKSILQTTFQLTHPAKDQLNAFCKIISQNPTILEKNLPNEIRGKVTIQEKDDGYQGCKTPSQYSSDYKYGIRLGKVYEINIEGVGVIRIGSDPSVECSYRRVTVELAAGMNTGQAMKQLSCILGMIGAGPALEPEPQEEDERKKIAFLFRTFYPEEAYPLEHLPQYYEVSIPLMKSMIVQKVPEMEEKFSKYLSDPSLITKVEITPGETCWRIPSLSEELKKLGAVGLMAGFQGDAETLAKVIIQGPLCSEKRFESGMVENSGTSSTQDLRSGGASSVFLRMVVKTMINNQIKNPIPDEIKGETVQASLVKRFPCSGEMQLLFDLDAATNGAYAYNEDKYGTKSSTHYAKRQNILEFTMKLNENSVKNELMVLHGIPDLYLKKILVRSVFSKENLIENFAENKEICEVRDDKHYLKGYNGPALEELIIVGKFFQEEMWG